MATRIYYLALLFPLRAILVNVARGIAPTLPGLAGVLAIRFAMGGGERRLGHVAIEVAAFAVLVAAATLRSERELLREFRGYLRRSAPPATVPA